VTRFACAALVVLGCGRSSGGAGGGVGFDSSIDTSRAADAAAVGDASTDASTASWPSAWTDLEDQVLPLLNQQRMNGATCGTTAYPAVPALVSNPQLRQAARLHSKDMVDNSYFSHTSPDGTYIFQRIYDAGYSAWSTDENIAGDYKTAAEVVAAWMASPGHCAAIMSVTYSFIPYQSNFTGASEVGVGYATSAAGGDWTLDFGWRAPATTPVTASCAITPATVAASASYTVDGSGLAANESIWETYATDDGITSVGGGAGSAGTFSNSATASAQGGEGWVVMFDYTTDAEIGRCVHH
jgi:uncharacterized protein YkwD